MFVKWIGPPSFATKRSSIRDSKDIENLGKFVHDVLFESGDNDDSDIDSDFMIETDHDPNMEEVKVDNPETRSEEVNQELEDRSENEEV